MAALWSLSYREHNWSEIFGITSNIIDTIIYEDVEK